MRLTLQEAIVRLRELEKQSNCSRAHVACLLLAEPHYKTMKYYVCGEGINGSDHPVGCQRPDEQGNCGCLHAEIGAIIDNAIYGFQPDIALISRAACERCAKVLAKAGVQRVYFLEPSWPQEAGFEVFRYAGISYERLSV